ncbi:hypothetical protein [Thiomicrorhabdus cannonii]|uniref:hypothetical protein n=1 Tax=Thiomicrorhabdus cannonii TaxID=2748011 RepID=UPI0015C00704|nr:hypothetical protein [Thiomicrorhabdus cannonii]
MCIVIIGLMLLLLYYADAQLATLSLSVTVEDQSTVVAQGWEMVVVLWPVAALLFLAGVLVVLMTLRVRSMLQEMRREEDA